MHRKNTIQLATTRISTIISSQKWTCRQRRSIAAIRSISPGCTVTPIWGAWYAILNRPSSTQSHVYHFFAQVFHVCALTDDGLIMKSFLCPESTLFDQTILKCNWWFYVDCKTSKSLYDSNLPVSKSYQLMKALTFFSNFKKSGAANTEEFDIEALKNSVLSPDEKSASDKSTSRATSTTIVSPTSTGVA